MCKRAFQNFESQLAGRSTDSTLQVDRDFGERGYLAQAVDWELTGSLFIVE